jgi:glutamate racemase
MVNAAPRVLVFDSGVGGLSVLDAIRASGWAFELDYLADNAWLPYGLKSDPDLRARLPWLLARVVEQWAPDAVVVACNTASTIALEDIRAGLHVPVVGVVPPIKPAAAMTRTGVVGLLATPATIRRAYTDDLVARYASNARVLRFGSTALVEAAEAKLSGSIPDDAAIAEAISGLFGVAGGDEIDVVALACTHFPLLTRELAAAAPRTCIWLDSGEAVARRLSHVTAAPAGEPRMRFVGFTDANAMVSLKRAFDARGFKEHLPVGPAPQFFCGRL